MKALNLTGISIFDSNGYGLVQYGSSIDYATSTVKQVVDAWKDTTITSGDIATARLIVYDELLDNLGYENNIACTGGCYYIGSIENVPSWVYNSNGDYWTMTAQSETSYIWIVGGNGNIKDAQPSTMNLVRPVLELNKSADITKLAS